MPRNKSRKNSIHYCLVINKIPRNKPNQVGQVLLQGKLQNDESRKAVEDGKSFHAPGLGELMLWKWLPC